MATKKQTKVILADGIKKVDYQVKNYTDGSGRIEVYYIGADGIRHGAVDGKRPYKAIKINKETQEQTEIVKIETRKQLIKRLCDSLGIAD